MGKPPNSRRIFMAAGALILLTLIVYLPIIHCTYVWDDDVNVTGNSNLTTLHGLLQSWTSLTANQQYYPLTYTSFWIEYHLWQLKPLGYHVDNVLLHALSAILLWFILRRLSVPGAWLAAAIWAIHPVNVESVAWITERKNTLSGVFYFSALLAYLHHAGIGEAGRAGNLRVYALGLGLFACALLSKTATSTLPAAILLILWWKRDRLAWRDVRDLLPFLVLAIIMGRVTSWVEVHHVGLVGTEWNLPMATRLIIAGKALAFYAGKLVWPLHLIHVYPRWQIDPGHIAYYVFPAMAIAIPAVLWLLKKRIGKWPLVAVLFFELTLLPVLGLVDFFFMRYSFVHDNYLYLAGIGITALIVGSLTNMIRRVSGLDAALPTVILLFLGMLCWRQVGIYQNERTLWTDTLSKNPNAWVGYMNLGTFATDEGKYDEAVANLEQCLKLYPGWWPVYLDLGIALSAKGETDRAIEALREAIRLAPRDAGTQFCLAESLAKKGRYDEAASYYEKLLKHNSKNAAVHSGLGAVLLKQGKKKEAIEHFRVALSLDPDTEQAQYGLELTVPQTSRPEAQAHYSKGLESQQEGDIADAMCEYLKALDIDPHFAVAHLRLGIILGNQGDTKKAIEEYQAAIRIRPDMAQAHANLAVAYYSQGDAADAWNEVKMCRRYGYRPDAEFLTALSRLMPDPSP